MRRNVRIPGIRATQEEKEKLERILGALGMQKTEWMCSVIDSHARLLEEARVEEVVQPRLALNGDPAFRIRTALAFALRSAGEEDPVWIMDQLVRILLDDGEYHKWCEAFKSLHGRQWPGGEPPAGS